MLRKEVVLMIILAAMSVGGCTLLSHEAPNEDIDKAAALFFQRLDKGEYDVIYNDASKRFKTNKTRDIVTSSLKELTIFGKTRAFDRAKMTIEGEGKDRMLLPVYRVLFETGSAEVVLTFLDEGGEWKLFGFTFKPLH